MRWSTNRSSRPPSAKPNRARRCVSSGASGGCTSSCPLMPEVRDQGVVRGRRARSHRYLPRRWARRSGAPGQPAAEVVGAGDVPADGPRVSTSAVGDGAAGHPPVQAAADDLDLGQLGHRLSPPGGGAAGAAAQAYAVAAACCSASFLLRPLPVAVRSAPTRTTARGEGLGVVGPALGRRRTRARRGPASAVSSCRLVFQSRPAPSVGGLGDQRVEQPVHQLGGGVEAAVEVDRADHAPRRCRPGSRPCPGRRWSPRRGRAAGAAPRPSSRPTSASARALTTAARSLASWPSGRSGWRAVERVGDDQARAPSRRGTPAARWSAARRSRRRTSGGSGRAAAGRGRR